MIDLAAKQEAFEESARLKHQFRALDDDEVEFLDSVLESTRAKEEAVKKETSEQLDIFRKHQEEADRALLREAGSSTSIPEGGRQAGSPTSEDLQWAVNARKRKRVKEQESLPGVKLRKSSSTVETVPGPNLEGPPASPTKASTTTSSSKPLQSKPPAELARTVKGVAQGTKVQQASDTRSKPTDSSLGLVGYSSDEED